MLEKSVKATVPTKNSNFFAFYRYNPPLFGQDPYLSVLTDFDKWYDRP
jgi:hypothetical protein